MMGERYKDDWLKIATKWISESHTRFSGSIPDLQDKIMNLEEAHRTVGWWKGVIGRLWRRIMI